MAGSAWTNQIQNTVIAAGTNAGVFVYNGSPKLGNPPIAWMTDSATDPFGNSIPSQMGVLGPSGVLSAFDSTGASGQLAAALLKFNNGIGGTLGSVSVFGPTGGLSLSGNIGAAASSLYLIADAASTVVSAGPVAINEPGQVAGTPEVWHAMTLVNSWANTAGFTAAQYRKVASPPNSVEIIGVIAATAATSTTFFTLPAAYVPTNAQGWPVGATANVPAGAVPQLRCSNTGVLTITNGAAPPSAVSYFIHGFISLDA